MNNRHKLLVVDDQPLNIALIHQAFETDHQVFSALSGVAALALCAKVRPDVVLLDVVMPGMDGFEVCARLKADPDLRHIPIIFVTVHDDEASEVRALEAGAVDFISKPINVKSVRARVSTHLQLAAAQRELTRSNTFLEQFAYAASHDLIEPLRSVSGSVQLLQKRYGGQLDARADEFIAHAVGGCQRMSALIADLLAYSRLNMGTQQPTAVSMGGALTNACGNLKVAIAQSQAQITHDPLPSVNADSTQMAQLLQNLVGNAIKFRGDKPATVHVGVRRHGNEWVFSVADQGIGIEHAHFARIFELFKRLHTQAEYAGTGVGLALCRRIVEHHGGRIWVESEPGQGTTFFFTMPVQSL